MLISFTLEGDCKVLVKNDGAASYGEVVSQGSNERQMGANVRKVDVRF